MSDDDSLISRWSKRKRAAQTEADKAPADPHAEPEVRPEPAEAESPGSAPDDTEEDILARFGLPDPDSLGPGDDYKGFMQAGVPDAIRRRALRKLWTSNPVLANLDGLNDYDEDFRSPEETAAVLKTAYKVGRGFLKDVMADTAEKAAPAAAEDGRGAAQAPREPATATPEHAESPEEQPVQSADLPRENTDVDASPVRPRRMRFDT